MTSLDEAEMDTITNCEPWTVRQLASHALNNQLLGGASLAHAWDLSASVGQPIEFSSEAMPSITALVERVCTDAVRDMGLIKTATEPPPDASPTERLTAVAGRSIAR